MNFRPYQVKYRAEKRIDLRVRDESFVLLICREEPTLLTRFQRFLLLNQSRKEENKWRQVSPMHPQNAVVPNWGGC